MSEPIPPARKPFAGFTGETQPFVFLAIGALLIILAIGSVSYTALSNAQRAARLHCGIDAINQVVAAFHARDDAHLRLNAVTEKFVVTRHNLLLALAGLPTSPPKTKEQAVLEYETAYPDYVAAINQMSITIKAAPLPDAKCLQSAAP